MFYGFDLGGSKIEVGVFDADMKSVWQKRVPTPRNDYDELLVAFAALTQEADVLTGNRGPSASAFPVCVGGGMVRCLLLTCLQPWENHYRRICNACYSVMFA